MAVIHTWSIENTERILSDGGITTIHWICTGVDGDYSASSYGTTSHTPDSSDAAFISFDSVSEADALGWCKAALDVDAIEGAIEAQINEMANPTTADGLPW